MNGTVNIRGKDYKTVALRVSEFREKHPDYSIQTKIISMDEAVVMKALIYDTEGRLVSTGFAEEVRGSTNINKTSALENCETSAIGRALASFGFAGSEYASANEVSDAIIQQAKLEAVEYFVEYNKMVRELFDSIKVIKDGIREYKETHGSDMSDKDARGLLSAAAEAYFELTNEEKAKLWIAPSKGGIFTTEEREIMKTSEFREAYHGGG